MKMPKWFKMWFKRYGILDKCCNSFSWFEVQRIAWRAYRKGKKDGKQLNK